MERQIQEYIEQWEQRCYHEGIPDEAPLEVFDKVPSYKKIAIAILKNDLSLIGIQPRKSEWYNILKRIEIDEREAKKAQANT